MLLLLQGSGDEPGGLEALCMSIFANLSYKTPEDGTESSTVAAKEMLGTGVLPCLLRSLASEGLRSKQVRAETTALLSALPAHSGSS